MDNKLNQTNEDSHENALLGLVELDTERLFKLKKMLIFPGNGKHALPPPLAFVDLNKMVDEPGKIFGLYKARHGCRIMFAFFFGILSLAFDLYLPFAIGIYANICNQSLNG